jgi:hypothetical protein
MDLAELKQRWRQWIEKNIGGPEDRLEIAMHAAISALSQGQRPDEAAAAARQAASTWQETQAPRGVPNTLYDYVLAAAIAPPNATYDPNEPSLPPFFANRENLDENTPSEISAEDLNGLRLADDALDVTLSHFAWRYAAIIGIIEVVPRFERHRTVSEGYALQFLTPAMIKADRQRFPQFLHELEGPPVFDNKQAVSFMVEMSDTPVPLCYFVLVREWPGGRSVRDLCNAWAAVKHAMSPAKDGVGMPPTARLNPIRIIDRRRRLLQEMAPEREVAFAAKETRTPAVATTLEPGRGFIRGRVAALKQRQERAFTNSITYPTGYQVVKTSYGLVWDFRLERSAPDGTPLQPIAVELRSHASWLRFGPDTKGFEGSVLNGDEVDVDARHYKPGKLLKIEQVRNLTSNSIVRATGSSPSPVFAAANTEKYSVIRGRVTTMQQRLDRPAVRIMVWSFRVQRTGPNGSLLPLVEVEMRSPKFEGSIVVGDEVELDASGYRTGDTVLVKQVRVLSSNSVARVRRGIWS